MKSREQWLMEWSQVPGWAKAIFALAIWLVVLSVFALEMEIRQTDRRPPTVGRHLVQGVDR